MVTHAAARVGQEEEEGRQCPDVLAPYSAARRSERRQQQAAGGGASGGGARRRLLQPLLRRLGANIQGANIQERCMRRTKKEERRRCCCLFPWLLLCLLLVLEEGPCRRRCPLLPRRHC